MGELMNGYHVVTNRIMAFVHCLITDAEYGFMFNTKSYLTPEVYKMHFEKEIKKTTCPSLEYYEYDYRTFDSAPSTNYTKLLYERLEIVFSELEASIRKKLYKSTVDECILWNQDTYDIDLIKNIVNLDSEIMDILEGNDFRLDDSLYGSPNYEWMECQTLKSEIRYNERKYQFIRLLTSISDMRDNGYHNRIHTDVKSNMRLNQTYFYDFV